ncbi:MAG TPA: hypothetical protein VGS07_05525 [Thermoanaerobaculia bacterium]|nr:hypothetical protein [Thermoanaerobaculia bacterium]
MVLAVVVWALVAAKRGGLTVRPLEIELGSSTEDLQKILEPAGNVKQLRRQIFIDWSFIASYWLFFLGASALLAAQTRWAGGLAALLATGMAWFDVRENLGILGTLQSFPKLVLERIRDTREASLLKWLLFFIALLLVAQMFVSRPDWTRWIGIVLAGSGLLGMAGLVQRDGQSLISGALAVALLGMVVAAIFWLSFPAVFLRSS